MAKILVVDDPRVSQADVYVIKSVALDELKGKIADLLSRKGSPQEEVGPKAYFSQFSIGDSF